MIIVMRVVGYANGNVCAFENQYLRNYVHETNDGQGYGYYTFDLNKAMRFDDMKAAIRFWQQVPACHPLCENGLPNRPMMAITMEFLSLDKLTGESIDSQS